MWQNCRVYMSKYFPKTLCEMQNSTSKTKFNDSWKNKLMMCTLAVYKCDA